MTLDFIELATRVTAAHDTSSLHVTAGRIEVSP